MKHSNFTKYFYEPLGVSTRLVLVPLPARGARGPWLGSPPTLVPDLRVYGIRTLSSSHVRGLLVSLYALLSSSRFSPFSLLPFLVLILFVVFYSTV